MNNTQKAAKLLAAMPPEEVETLSTLFLTFLTILPHLANKPQEEVLKTAFQLGNRYTQESEETVEAIGSLVTGWRKNNADA